jgi:hypothetical protein
MTTINKELSRCIKSIGHDLIKRADDISNDVENVTSININAIIEKGTIINYDVTKNYSTLDYIHYEKINKTNKKES